MLEIHEILDRFELLYPENNDIADLRKLVLDQNTWSLWRILDKFVETRFITALKQLQENGIDFDTDCFSRGQLESKKWLVGELLKLDVELGIVSLCGGWYGTLATMLFESGAKVTAIRSFDIDPDVVKIAEIFNKPWFIDNWKFKAITQDIHEINYGTNAWSMWSSKNNRMSNPIIETPNTVINTSCEHIGDFDKWYDKIPKGKLVILQSNNYFDVPEHTNCSKSVSEFADITPMTDVLYEGELLLDKYTRFMRIGYR